MNFGHEGDRAEIRLPGSVVVEFKLLFPALASLFFNRYRLGSNWGISDKGEKRSACTDSHVWRGNQEIATRVGHPLSAESNKVVIADNSPKNDTMEKDTNWRCGVSAQCCYR